MKEALKKPCLSVVPVLEEYQVYKKICKAKKPNSSGKGDLPKRLYRNLAVNCQPQ